MTKEKTMTNKGIDYGRGMTNIDTDSGIRFGVIPIHDVLQAWADSSESQYPEDTDGECPECGETYEGKVGQTITCAKCQEEFELELPDWAEPSCFTFEDEGYKAEQGADDTDIFIIRSPYYTYAQFCSPCAPGACHLRNPIDEQDNDNKCYCFGHDWFEDGKAPYTVYSVATGEVIDPE